MLTPSILIRRSYRKPSNSLHARIKSRKSKTEGLRRARYSILRNRAAKDFDRSSLFTTGRRQFPGQPESFRGGLSQRNTPDDYSSAAELDANHVQVRRVDRRGRRRAFRSGKAVTP